MCVKQIWLGNSTVPFPGGSVVKNPPANAGDARDTGSALGQQDPLEEEMATHSSILAWRIPWTEESTCHKKSDTTEHALILEQGNPGPLFLLSLKPQRVFSIESPPHTLPDLKPTLPHSIGCPEREDPILGPKALEICSQSSTPESWAVLFHLYFYHKSGLFITISRPRILADGHCAHPCQHPAEEEPAPL